LDDEEQVMPKMLGGTPSLVFLLGLAAVLSVFKLVL